MFLHSPLAATANAEEAPALGKPVLVKLSDNATGFLNVLKQADANRTKPFYAKFDLGDGSKQKTLNGSTSATAEEAACKLAYFLAGHAGELPPVQKTAGRRTSEVCPLRPPCMPSHFSLLSVPLRRN